MLSELIQDQACLPPTNSPHQSNEWHVPPGRYSAILTQVLNRSSDEVRLVFTLSESCGLIGRKKAGKLYSTKRPIWLEKDLSSWLGLSRVKQLAADGDLSLDALHGLVGISAVLVVTNQDHGQSVPLSVISAILPHTLANLKGGNAGGPKFRMSFSSQGSDSAMAA